MNFSVHHHIGSGKPIRYPPTAREQHYSAEAALDLMRELVGQRRGSAAYAVSQPPTKTYSISELQQLIATTPHESIPTQNPSGH